MASNKQGQWILEFLLRQPVEDCDMIHLIPALFPPVHDHAFAKTFLFRQVSFVINKGFVLEDMLETLELIQVLDLENGNMVSDSMRGAYCAVAKCFLVKSLKEDAQKYEHAVYRVWRNVILRAEIEEVLRDISVLQSVSVEDVEKEALDAVKLLLENSRKQMGPSFLEKVEKTLLEEGENVQSLVDTVTVNNHVRIEDEGENVQPSVDAVAVDNHVRVEEEEFVHSDAVGQGTEVSHENMSGDTGNGMDTHCSVERLEITTRKRNPVSTPEFERVRDTLRSSVLELHEAVVDPLPDAILEAVRIAREVANDVQSSENQSDMVMNMDTLCDHSINIENGLAREGNPKPSAAVSRPNIFERNNTARTFEWDEHEDEETSTETSRRRIHLPSPQSIRLSPLRKEVIRNTSTTGRRIRKRWSNLEEATLIEAVRTYGRGCWKVILDAHRDIFDGRTEVDLKDKWRNLNK